MHVQFKTLVDESRVWVFPLAKPLSEDSEQALSLELTQFVENWKAHSKAVSGSFEIIGHQIVVVAADIFSTDVSGCSIDSLFKAVTSAAEKISNNVADPSMIFFRSGEKITAASREQFKEGVTSGMITSEFPVFDFTIQNVAAIRKGELEKVAKDSWHKQAFFKA